MKQQQITSVPVDQTNHFFEDITTAFLQANVPLEKLQNAQLRAFLENYTGKSLPNESTARKK